MTNKIIIVRTKKCRKSDVMLRFLRENNIPHEVKFVETDPEAKRLWGKFNLKASPGIIIGEKTFNPYELVKNCRVQQPEKTKALFLKYLSEEETEYANW